MSEFFYLGEKIDKFPSLYHYNKQSLQLISYFYVCIKIISCSSVNLLKNGLAKFILYSSHAIIFVSNNQKGL